MSKGENYQMIIPLSVEQALLRLTVADGSGTFDPSVNRDVANVLRFVENHGKEGQSYFQLSSINGKRWSVDLCGDYIVVNEVM